MCDSSFWINIVQQQGVILLFLKVKRTAGKQYFALCESVRRDNKVVTKSIRSLGNADKALLILKAEYPQFLDRFNEIVGTKKCRDNILYGLYNKDENEFKRVCYSGMYYKLLYTYKTYDAAEEERKSYSEPGRLVVKEIPNELLLADEKESERREEAFKRYCAI